jgi:hypothetical protein
MRYLLLAIPVSLLLVSSHAGAQSKDYPFTSASDITTVEVTGHQRLYHVTREQTNAVKGKYAMSNGWFLDVQPGSRDIVARIDNERPMHLLAVSSDKFVTPDGNVTMEFNRGQSGDDMLMSYVPSSNLAAVITIGSTMASR